MVMNKKGASFGAIVATIGSILIALGFAWLIAQNWHQIPSPLKIIILLGLTSSAFVAGTFLIKKDYPAVGKALFALGCLLYTLSIFLIAQIFFVRGGWQGMAWLWLIAWIGVMAAAYIFDSSLSLFIGLIEIIIWLVIQYLAFTNASLGILALYLLALGVLLYGLNLLHRYNEHRFSEIYRWWTAFYFLTFTYILSFQTLLPRIWPKEIISSTGTVIFLVFLGIIALILLGGGVVLLSREKKPNFKEVWGFGGLVILLILLINLTRLVANAEGDYDLFRGGNFLVSLWVVWIVINLFFIGLIIGIIGYGTWQKMPSLINLGIVFFSLDIITRYIGFILDFGGYVGLSVFFIIGGILLLGGGWLVERWRKKLIANAQ